jgi:Met-zincin
VYGLRELSRSSQVLLRQIGGVVTRRAATFQGTDALRPLAADRQRAALEELLRTYLNPEAIDMPAALQRRLGPDYLERADNGDGNTAATDFSWAQQLLALQRPVLDGLMSEGLAERLMDNVDKVRDQEARPLTLKELNKRLFDAVWATPLTRDDLSPAWRSLQREHVNRLAVAVVRASAGRADVRAVVRQQAQRVLQHLKAHRSGGPDSTAEAHRQDCIQSLSAALQANVVRNTP